MSAVPAEEAAQAPSSELASGPSLEVLSSAFRAEGQFAVPAEEQELWALVPAAERRVMAAAGKARLQHGQ